ncbi:MAG: Omp28-related outer membrane protein [Chitinophagales bacterium]|nr:Omp28-related outer membrane protein [Chitinophagales bacterium]
MQGSLGTWAVSVDAVLNEASFCNLNLNLIEVNETERTLRFSITVEYSALSPNHNLGIYLTESDIETEQLDGVTHIHDYIHEFVLRKSITPIIGESLGDAIEANTVKIKEYLIDLDDYDSAQAWNILNMHLVAFIRTDNQEIETATMVDVD